MMSKIQITAEIDATNLGQVEAAATFLRAVGGHEKSNTMQVVPDETPEPKKRAPRKKTPPKEETKKEPVKTEAPKEQEEAKESASDYTIDDVRKAVTQNVGKHRDALKEELSRLGADNVTKLSEDKYGEFMDFISML